MKSTDINQASAGRLCKREEGFTLIETSIALVVMMVVGLGAASLFFYAVGANSTARDRELSMAVAQQQMERLRNTEFLDLDTVVTATGGANKTETSADRGYTVVTTIANTFAGNESLKTITVQVVPLGDTPLAGITSVFGGVTLVTIRSSTGVGEYVGP
ncbi:MAG TPA: prepilin-type N-terminal cleavage/methylation domain-containing protein [Pyrinomonadaceae bacterium]|nr:prepilin-type N-terminal cleavage/methylation domain-containing protein [Pyrinomonadaceae bacterium]